MNEILGHSYQLSSKLKKEAVDEALAHIYEMSKSRDKPPSYLLKDIANYCESLREKV